MKETFRYQYCAKPWMDEVLAIRAKYLPRENNRDTEKGKKFFNLTIRKHFVKKNETLTRYPIIVPRGTKQIRNLFHFI